MAESVVQNPIFKQLVIRERIVEEPVHEAVQEPMQEAVQVPVQEPVHEGVNVVSRADTDTTNVASTEPSVCTNNVFPRGPSDRSVLTGLVDHVAYRIWQGEVCILVWFNA